MNKGNKLTDKNMNFQQNPVQVIKNAYVSTLLCISCPSQQLSIRSPQKLAYFFNNFTAQMLQLSCYKICSNKSIWSLEEVVVKSTCQVIYPAQYYSTVLHIQMQFNEV